MFYPGRYETTITFREDFLTSKMQKFRSTDTPTVTIIGPDNYQGFMRIEVGKTTMVLPISSVERIITVDSIEDSSQDRLQDSF